MKNRVTVNLSVVVECSGVWNDNCTVEQIKKQARIEAVDRICKRLNDDPMVKVVTCKEVSLTAIL